MENENMNYEDNVMESEIDVVETEEVKSGIGAGKVLLIGAGVVLAATAGIKLAKNLWAKHKAKKELHRIDTNGLNEVTDEQVMEDDQE